MLIVVRHGQTDWNLPPRIFQGHLDIELNSVGRRQAEEFALRLDKNVEIIFSSPLKRALETAKIIKGILENRFNKELKIETDKRLREVNCGSWHGLKYDTIIEKYPESWYKLTNLDLEFRFPQGESLKELLERFLSALKDIVINYRSYEYILVVTHGGPMRLFKKYILKEEKPKVNNLDSLYIEKETILRLDTF